MSGDIETVGFVGVGLWLWSLFMVLLAEAITGYIAFEGGLLR
jgi:hypothetical protein